MLGGCQVAQQPDCLLPQFLVAVRKGTVSNMQDVVRGDVLLQGLVITHGHELA